MKKHFITGLVIILPIVLTVVIIAFLLRLLTNPFEGITLAILKYFGIVDKPSNVVNYTQLTLYLSRFLILLMLIGVTFVMGIVGRWFFIHEILKLSDWLFHRIPLVNKIYRASQETVTTLFNAESRTFKQVVLVPFPHRPGLSIGLITADTQADLSDPLYRNLVSVFIPGTPNPTVGFLLLYRREEITPLQLSVEEAMKYIISCGVMLPPKKSQGT